ncbi:MAG: SPOR domain-containing protein [Bacteroidia bacterium]|nr:SPOR domain-containing protein [Bacteroidia bacterium]
MKMISQPVLVRSMAWAFGLLLGLTTPAVLQAQAQYHYLIAGSFNDFEAANQLSSALKIKGFTPAILFPGPASPKYRVSVYQAVNKVEVESFQRSRGADASKFWILSVSDPASTASQNRVTTPVSAPTASKTPAAATSRGKTTTYHLVVASFAEASGAMTGVANLRNQGFTPYVIYPDATNGNFRVSVYKATDKKEIQTYANMLKKRGKTPGIIVEETLPFTTSTQAATLSGADVTFHLIGGSYKTYDQAREYAEGMKAKGYKTFILLPENGMGSNYRVSVFWSVSKAEVESYKKQKGLKTAWVLEQR